MKQFKIQRACVALICLVAVLGFTGCGSSDDDGPPENIAGTWAAKFTMAGEADLVESWTIVQAGQTVTGSYTYDGNTWSYNGTYVNGVFSAVDADNWALNLVFSGDTGTGTISGDGEVWNAVLTR